MIQVVLFPLEGIQDSPSGAKHLSVSLNNTSCWFKILVKPLVSTAAGCFFSALTAETFQNKSAVTRPEQGSWHLLNQYNA